MAGVFRGLRDYGTTGLRDYETTGRRDIADDARVVSLARFPGVLRHSQAFSVLPSKSRATNYSRASTSRTTNFSHPTLASLPPRTTERTNKRTDERANERTSERGVRLFVRSVVRSRPFAPFLSHSFATFNFFTYLCTIYVRICARDEYTLCA